MNRVDQPRQAALQLLKLVRDEGAYANLALSQVLKEHALNGRDAAFTVELAYGVLRNQLLYDSYIAECANRELTAVEPDILDILRLGVHQIIAMRVPDHAAVDSSVNLARDSGTGGQATARGGFVNAVLRCVIRGEESRDSSSLPIDIAYSHPQWIIDSYRNSLHKNGRSAEEIAELLASNNTPAKPVIAVRSGDLDIPGTIPGKWLPSARVLDSVIPQELFSDFDRHVIVQDEGSQLVAQAFLNARPVGRESAWLDMCAGPGGKAAIISDHLPDGVMFTAVELHEHRGRLIEKVIAPGSHVVVADARTRPWGNLFFDRVLVDAPCTGLGALRRRPEARWRKQESDLVGLNSLQEDLLNAALDSTRSGGIVCYVTCSPHLDETLDLLANVLGDRTDSSLEDARPLFPGVDQLGPGPTVQLWPHVHGTDAMFFALIRRK